MFSASFIRQGLRNLHCKRLFRTTTRTKQLSLVSPVNNYGIILKQTTSFRLFCVTKEKKRVTIFFKKMNGETIKRQGFVGETIQDLIDCDDPELLGYGCCCGTLSCSTCHIILKPEDFERLTDKPTDEELDLIAYAPSNCETSRLGCAVELTEKMDGLVVTVPDMTRDQRAEFDK